jgi:hypothetical protein
MTRGILNRHNSKQPEVKIFFGLDLFLTKCVRIIAFLLKNFVLSDFSIIKLEHPPFCGGVFVFPPTRQPIGVLPASYWSPGSHI